jgi:hypothetical protein
MSMQGRPSGNPNTHKEDSNNTTATAATTFESFGLKLGIVLLFVAYPHWYYIPK